MTPNFSRFFFVFSNRGKLDTPTQLNRIETKKPRFTAPIALALIHEFPSTPIISISEILFDLRYEINSSDEKASACSLQNTLSDARMSSSANSSDEIYHKNIRKDHQQEHRRHPDYGVPVCSPAQPRNTPYNQRGTD